MEQLGLPRSGTAADLNGRPGARADTADGPEHLVRRCRGAGGGRVVSYGAAVRRAGGSGFLAYIGDKPVTAPVDGLDDPLISAGVAHGAAGGLDPAGQRRLRDEPVTPD